MFSLKKVSFETTIIRNDDNVPTYESIKCMFMPKNTVIEDNFKCKFETSQLSLYKSKKVKEVYTNYNVVIETIPLIVIDNVIGVVQFNVKNPVHIAVILRNDKKYMFCELTKDMKYTNLCDKFNITDRGINIQVGNQINLYYPTHEISKPMDTVSTGINDCLKLLYAKDLAYIDANSKIKVYNDNRELVRTSAQLIKFRGHFREHSERSFIEFNKNGSGVLFVHDEENEDKTEMISFETYVGQDILGSMIFKNGKNITISFDLH